MENDYALLRRWERRASLGTFLSVVIQHLLENERDRLLGRWQPSSEARRMGDAGLALEKLVRRDRRPLAEAIPIMQALEPALTAEAIEAMADRLPLRIAGRRAVALDDAAPATLVAPDAADRRAVESELRRLSERANHVVRGLLASLPLEDRMLLRLRFASSLSIATVSRILRVPQRPLYRRQEALLAKLQAALTAAGIDGSTASDLIGAVGEGLDFELSNGKSETVERSEEIGEQP
jgi:DNA-directed RNA polymerase specialized sigma24 family protein